MESGPSSYRFAPVRRLGLPGQGSEGLPLEVLGMLSRGQPSGSTNQVHMRPHPLDRNATIAQLVAESMLIDIISLPSHVLMAIRSFFILVC